jgi:putative transposase
MYKVFKYRLYPNVNQTRELEITLETHRRLWNQCLAQRKTAYDDEKKSISYLGQCRWFTAEKKSNPWFARLNAQSAQATMRRLDAAFNAFFRRIKAGQKPGYPRFKGRDRLNSFTYPQVPRGAKLGEGIILLHHIGSIRVRLHRPIEGAPKTIVVKREAGKWYAFIVCDLGDIVVENTNTDAVGIDVGLESFLTTSDGECIAPFSRSNGSSAS